MGGERGGLQFWVGGGNRLVGGGGGDAYLIAGTARGAGGGGDLQVEEVVEEMGISWEWVVVGICVVEAEEMGISRE